DRTDDRLRVERVRLDADGLRLHVDLDSFDAGDVLHFALDRVLAVIARDVGDVVGGLAHRVLQFGVLPVEVYPYRVSGRDAAPVLRTGTEPVGATAWRGSRLRQARSGRQAPFG